MVSVSEVLSNCTKKQLLQIADHYRQTPVSPDDAAAFTFDSFGFLSFTMHAHPTPLIILTLTPHVIALSDLSLLLL